MYEHKLQTSIGGSRCVTVHDKCQSQASVTPYITTTWTVIKIKERGGKAN
jgi:hypothetical protein